MDTPKGAARTAFAQRLAELRSDSGRTYQSLARRVDVSASSLHRYCSGQTVPLEFAPVERLARFCGCEGDALVALHRLWVLADAERNRPREPVASVPDPVTPAPDAFGTSAGARRRRRLAGATAAFLTTATVIMLLTASGDSSPPATGRPSVPEAKAATGPGAVPSSAPSLSPAAPAGPGSGERAPGGSGRTERPVGTASGRTAAGPRPGTGAATAPDAGRGPSPFTWNTDDHVWKNGCDHAYLIGRTAAGVPPPPAESDAEAWARSLGALHASDTGVRITLQGRSERAVVLESLRVRVSARREPVRLDVHRMNSGCGGALTPRLFDVDLDRSRPVARSVAGNDSGEPLPAVTFPYTVSATDPEVFLVTGRTDTCDCDWYLELEWTSGGRTGVVRIDDGGRPFRTSGARGRPVFDYDTGARRWVPAGRTDG